MTRIIPDAHDAHRPATSVTATEVWGRMRLKTGAETGAGIRPRGGASPSPPPPSAARHIRPPLCSLASTACLAARHSRRPNFSTTRAPTPNMQGALPAVLSGARARPARWRCTSEPAVGPRPHCRAGPELGPSAGPRSRFSSCAGRRMAEPRVCVWQRGHLPDGNSLWRRSWGRDTGRGWCYYCSPASSHPYFFQSPAQKARKSRIALVCGCCLEPDNLGSSCKAGWRLGDFCSHTRRPLGRSAAHRSRPGGVASHAQSGQGTIRRAIGCHTGGWASFFSSFITTCQVS